MSMMSSPPVLTNSSAMLSTQADFPIFSALTSASTSSRMTGRDSSFGIYGNLSVVGSKSVS